MVKAYLGVLILLLIVPAINAYDLREYPSFFGNVSLSVRGIIGETASTSDIHAMNGLVMNLLGIEYQSFDNNPPKFIENYRTILDNEISDLSRSFIISLGGPCANKITAQIMNVSPTWPDCAQGFDTSESRIIVYNNWNKTQIVVAGYSADDTLKAAKILQNYQNVNLSGYELRVSGSVDYPRFRRIVTEYEKTCYVDDDCVMKKGGCCCSLTAMDKQFVTDWEHYYDENCRGKIACVAKICDFVGEPHCENNRCVLS